MLVDSVTAANGEQRSACVDAPVWEGGVLARLGPKRRDVGRCAVTTGQGSRKSGSRGLKLGIAPHVRTYRKARLAAHNTSARGRRIATCARRLAHVRASRADWQCRATAGPRSSKARCGSAERAKTFRSWALFAVDTLFDCSQDATALVAMWSAMRPVRGAFRRARRLRFSHRCAPCEPMKVSGAPRCQANCDLSPDAEKPASGNYRWRAKWKGVLDATG
jgi:hypothetical protein